LELELGLGLGAWAWAWAWDFWRNIAEPSERDEVSVPRRESRAQLARLRRPSQEYRTKRAEPSGPSQVG